MDSRMMPEVVAKQYWSRGGITPEIREEIEKLLAAEHGDNKKSVLEPARLSTTEKSPKLRSQSTLGSEDNKRSEQNKPNGIPDPSLPDLLLAVSKYFTSPLAKGRIFKSLKAFPIKK